MSGKRNAAILALLLALLGGWVGAGDDSVSALRKRADEVLAGTRPLSEVRIEVVWTKPGKHHLLVWGSGGGVWNHERQFRLSEKDLRAMLKLLVKRGFFEMPDKPKPGAPTPPRSQPQAPQVLRAVAVRIGELEKLVSQNNRVRTFQPLDDLVGELFALCEKPAAAGVSVGDLEDALAKVASGTLAPETLAITVSEPPVPPSGAQPAADGLMVRLDEGRIERIVQPHEGALAETRWRLAPAEIGRIAALLREIGFSRMPGNLYRSRYADVQVVVLNQRKNVQARPFAGMDPRAHPAEQAALERIVRLLFEMHSPPGDSGK